MTSHAGSQGFHLWEVVAGTQHAEELVPASTCHDVGYPPPKFPSSASPKQESDQERLIGSKEQLPAEQCCTSASGHAEEKSFADRAGRTASKKIEDYEAARQAQRSWKREVVRAVHVIVLCLGYVVAVTWVASVMCVGA